MSLPPSSDFTGSSVTEGGFKTALTSLRNFLAGLLGTDENNKVAALTALGALMNSGLTKTGAYTVVAADKGKVIRCNGTFTLSITAAATLADGFAFAVLNEGTGTITIDPNGSELIDGATTKALAAGKLAIVYCNGSSFTTVGSIATGSGSGLDADTLDTYHASAFSQTSHTHSNYVTNSGSTSIGAYAEGNTTSGPYTVGSNYSGASFSEGSMMRICGGTWKCIHQTSFGTDPVNYGGVFQRIS